MNMIKKLKKGVFMILEGRGLLDKFKVFLWFFGFRKGLFLKNKDGIFYVRPNSSDLWMLVSLGDESLRRHFNLKKGVFLDVGANVGKYSIIMGKKFKKKGHVFSFEPEDSNVNAFKRNLKLNGLKNITIFPFACTKEEGKLALYINKKNSGGHSLVKKVGQKKFVKGIKLDNLIKENKIKNIGLIKIDVEGAEIDVLKGCQKTLRKHHPKIIFEAWTKNYLEKIEEVLMPLGYKIKKINKTNYFAEWSEKD